MCNNKFKFFIALGLTLCQLQNSLAQKVVKGYPINERLQSYKTFSLKTDTALLSEAERKCVVHLIKAAQKADEIFWKQSYKDKKLALDGIKNDTLRKFIEINYGPWDRLNDDKPFVQGVGEKPKSANFYFPGFNMEDVPADIKHRVLNPYTVIIEPKIEKVTPPTPMSKGQAAKPIEMPPMMERMKTLSGKEIAVMDYGNAYPLEIRDLMMELNAASKAIETEDPKLSQFLRDRGAAIMSGEYLMNDIKWLMLKSHLDIIIGPIENYEDKLLGVKTAFEAYVLVRDQEWGKRLDRYVSLLPQLQEGIPVEPDYKPALNDKQGEILLDPHGNIMSPTGDMVQKEGYPPMPIPSASLSQLAVFDVVYYGGDCNAGSKTIAVNLPNDEVLQKYYGTRRSQLKNAMQAKFDNMVVPISNELIPNDQRSHIKFEAFFSNVMFHEVAHGLGVKNLVKDQNKTVRDALGANYSAIEECKADVLGLYMVTKLVEMGELKNSLADYYVTFVASTFRSVRFGAANAHGKANMITFNTLLNSGAIEKNSKSYIVNVEKMKVAIENLAAELLHLQGNGDVAGVQNMLATRGVIGTDLQKDLDRLKNKNIPVDLVFDQGIQTLGLTKYDESAQKPSSSKK